MSSASKIITNIILIVIIVITIFYLKNELTENLEEKRVLDEEKEQLEALYEKQKEEQKTYSTYIEKSYENQQYDNPYLPEGFTYVEGTWNTGYVIQDENENQYVWVPVTNLENIEGVVKIKRKDFGNEYFTRIKNNCYDTEYEEFLKSALENGGFYISRFEIGKSNENTPVSQKGAKIWVNLSIEEAKNIIKDMYKGASFNIQLMNSYAYDTAFEWIINTYGEDQITASQIKYDEQGNRITGNQSYNNIYDLLDYTYEMTTEVLYNGRVVTRGKTGMDEDTISNRASFITEVDETIGFRTIIYK